MLLAVRPRIEAARARHATRPATTRSTSSHSAATRALSAPEQVAVQPSRRVLGHHAAADLVAHQHDAGRSSAHGGDEARRPRARPRRASRRTPRVPGSASQTRAASSRPASHSARQSTSTARRRRAVQHARRRRGSRRWSSRDGRRRSVQRDALGPLGVAVARRRRWRRTRPRGSASSRRSASCDLPDRAPPSSSVARRRRRGRGGSPVVDDLGEVGDGTRAPHGASIRSSSSPGGLWWPGARRRRRCRRRPRRPRAARELARERREVEVPGAVVGASPNVSSSSTTSKRRAAHAAIVVVGQRPGVGGVEQPRAVGRGDVVEHGVAGELVGADVVRGGERAHDVAVDLERVAGLRPRRSDTGSCGPTQSRQARDRRRRPDDLQRPARRRPTSARAARAGRGGRGARG